ncbi:hypothetical protein V6N13_075046 [Hibiscus sabdariffa]
MKKVPTENGNDAVPSQSGLQIDVGPGQVSGPKKPKAYEYRHSTINSSGVFCEFQSLEISRSDQSFHGEHCHLGPESSMASSTSDDSSMKSEYLCGGLSHDSNFGVFTICEASHFSAKPSPSSILNTSDIFGRCNGLN